MATPSLGQEFKVKVRRTFAAPRERVFAAWTQPDQLAHWMCRPDPKNCVKYLEFELQEGRGYLLEVRLPSGPVYMNRGEYKLVKPPEKLAFTWGWERFDAAGNKTGELNGSLVTVEFHDLGESTEVVLTHEYLPDMKERDSHEKGWNGCFDQLAEYLGSPAK